MIPGVVSCVMVLLGGGGGGESTVLIFDDFVGAVDTPLAGRTPPSSTMGNWNIDEDLGLDGKLSGDGYAIAGDSPIVGGYFYNGQGSEVPHGFEIGITFRMPSSPINDSTVDWQTIASVWTNSYDGEANAFLEVMLRYINPSYGSEEPYTGLVLRIGSQYSSINLWDGADEEGYFTIPLPELSLDASSTHMLFVSIKKSGSVQVWIDDVAYFDEECNTTVTGGLSSGIEEVYFETHPGDPVPDTDPPRAPADIDEVMLEALGDPGSGEVVYLLDEFDGPADDLLAGRTPTITISQLGNWLDAPFTTTGKLDGDGFAVQSVPGDIDGVNAVIQSEWEGPWPGPGTGAEVPNGFRLSCTFRLPATALNTFNYLTAASFFIRTKAASGVESELSVELAYTDASNEFELNVFSSLDPYGDAEIGPIPLYGETENFTIALPAVNLEPSTLHTLTLTIWPADEFSTNWVQIELDNETVFADEGDTQVVEGILTDIIEIWFSAWPGEMLGEEPAVSSDLSRVSLTAFDVQSPS